MDATWYNRVDIHMENLRSAPKFAQHYPEPSPAVYSCTWAEIESIIDFIVTNLY
jgi:hypothetical protein